MKLIKKVIRWLIKLFRQFFGRRKVVKKIKSNIHTAKNKRYIKGYGTFVNNNATDSLPIYLFVDNAKKKEIIHKVYQLENKMEINHNIDGLVKKIEDSNMSFYQCEKINEILDEVINKEIKEQERVQTITKINEDIIKIIDNFDLNIGNKVLDKYDEVNYLTLTTMILDETLEEIKKVSDDYKHHRFNKYYYNRALNRIKERINNLKKYSETEDVRKEILELRRNMYMKNKDKFDLLYSNEIYLDIEATCDELLDKVNRRIIDLKIQPKKEKKEIVEKKEKEKKKIPEKTKKEKREELEYLENIIKRFQDLELASQLILLNKNENLVFNKQSDIIQYLNKKYYSFLNGEKAIFNFERNKTKTELVKLYNDLNQIDCVLNKKDMFYLDYINYPYQDLVEMTINKKREVDENLKEKYHYQVEKHEPSILVDNKLNILLEEEKAKKQARQLVKK